MRYTPDTPAGPLALALVLAAGPAAAVTPCGDFGECKVLVEINATDGDVGFHFLVDGDDLNEVFMDDPTGARTFHYQVKGPLKDQKLTETFAESAEPPCQFNGEDDEVVSLEEFLERWEPGTYTFWGKSDNGEHSRGEATLTHALPAAPVDPEFDGTTIVWNVLPAGSTSPDSLGECSADVDLQDLVDDGLLDALPADVPVAAFEAVLEPVVPEGDPIKQMKFSIRVPGTIAPLAVTVPADYLASLPPNTLVKWEVGAIGLDDNATFSEGGGSVADGFCVNQEGAGCTDPED